MSTSSTSPPLQTSSSTQPTINNCPTSSTTSNSTVSTKVSSTNTSTMPSTITGISSSTTTASSITSLSTTTNNASSSTNNSSNNCNNNNNNSNSNSILNCTTSKNKSNLLANHLNSNHLNTTNSTILTEQPAGNGSQNFCIKWNQHTTNLIKNLTEMVIDQQIVDVTLACDGSSIKAHKIILSACSNYFKDLFLSNPCKHPIVILKDIKISELKAIIDFMYKGEVNVSQAQLSSLLKTAEILRIKGLTEVAGESGSEKVPTSGNQNNVSLINKLTGLDNNNSTAAAVAAVAAAAGLNGKILNNTHLSYENLPINDSNIGNSDQQIIENNLFNLANLSNNLRKLSNNSTLLNLRDATSQSELFKRKKKRKRSGNFNLYSNKNLSALNHNQITDNDQAISLVTTNKDNSENNENSSNSCNSSNNSTDSNTVNNSLRNLCYIKKEQIIDQPESDCGNCSGDESVDVNTLRRMKDLMNAAAVAAAAAACQQTGSSVANFYRSSTPESSNQSLLAIRRKFMQQQFNTLSPKTAQDIPDNSDNQSWLQSRQMVEASLIEPYEEDNEEMIDVRPIVSFDEGSSNVPTNFNSDQMVVINPLEINSMSSSTPTTQSGKICVCHLCHLTFTAYSSLRRHMQRHYADRERYECDICLKSYSRKDYLKEHKKLKHSNTIVPNIVAN